MSRNKKPTELKVLSGNPGKRQIPKDEVKPAPVADPCPKWFDKYAKEIWKELSPRLEKNGQLTEDDFLDFQALCIASGILRKAYADLKKKKTLTSTTPSGYEQQRPELGIISTQTKIIISLSSKFGLSPSDRAGLVNPKAGEKRSKLAGLLSG
jgi:P27 family predicted phage terminase small subunit